MYIPSSFRNDDLGAVHAILMERERDGGLLSYLRGEGDSEARDTYHVYMQEAMNRLRVALTRLAELDAQRQQRRAR